MDSGSTGADCGAIRPIALADDSGCVPISERETGSGKRRKRETPAAVRCVVPVHVQPRAAKTEVAGLHGDAIKIRLKAPPVEGAANDALIRFLAKKLGVPRHAVRIVSGATSRTKRVSVDGIELPEVMNRLT
ncbi:MAG: YggU family protein [Gemmatimonadetes bacterium]|nr:YggU family protein [Gemmatimonadota bacterium]